MQRALLGSMMRLLVLAPILVLVGCSSSDPEITPNDPAPAPCQSNVLFQELDGRAALNAIEQNRPIQIHGCFGGACFDDRLAMWERINGDYVARVQDQAHSQWVFRVTATPEAKLSVNVVLADRVLENPVAATATINTGLIGNENGIHRAEEATKVTTGSIRTFSTCD